MIKWIFFDVGNVILNDDPAMAVLYKYIYEAIDQNRVDVTFKDLLVYREYSIVQNRDGQHFKTVGIKFLGEENWKDEFKKIRKKLVANWDKISPLLPGVVPTIQHLANKFNLGLIANQPREVMRVLEYHQLTLYFKVNAISALVGDRKPDPRIYQYALETANCQPMEAIMIGDRIDNDIVPAKLIGMKTIWLKLPLEKKGYEPMDEFEELYFKSLIRASASHISPRTEAEQPNYTAKSFEEVLKGVEYLSNTE